MGLIYECRVILTPLVLICRPISTVSAITQQNKIPNISESYIGLHAGMKRGCLFLPYRNSPKTWYIFSVIKCGRICLKLVYTQLRVFRSEWYDSIFRFLSFFSKVIESSYENFTLFSSSRKFDGPRSIVIVEKDFVWVKNNNNNNDNNNKNNDNNNNKNNNNNNPKSHLKTSCRLQNLQSDDRCITFLKF